MADYPDWTTPIAVKSSDIQVPADIQGAYIMVPTDWQDQYVGVYPQPEWAAKQQTDKNFTVYAVDLTSATYAVTVYTVPAGKTLFINNMAGYAYGYAMENRNQFMFCAVALYDATTGEYVFVMGGNGGAGLSFHKPYRFPAGHQVWFMIFNWGFYHETVRAVASGYEI